VVAATLDKGKDENVNMRILKNVPPFMLVNILGYDFPAFLDTGSPLSFLGNEVIEMLREKHIQTKPCYKKINFLRGFYICSEEVTLSIKFADQSRRQKFYILPGTITTILLGRDFLSPAMIGLHVGCGGWSIGLQPEFIYPFVSNRSNTVALTEVEVVDPLKDDQNLIKPVENFTNDESLQSSCKIEEEVDLISFVEDPEDPNEEFAYPAAVLAQYENPDFSDDSDSDQEDESPLYQDRPNFIQVRKSLDEGKRQQLREVLDEFLPIFTKAPGFCNLYEHKIDTGNSPPISTSLRPMNAAKRAIFDETFDELLEYGVIEPANSPWASSGFVVPKKDGSFRFVVDYKPLNKVTVRDNYPIPRIDDILKYLGTAEWSSTFDLSKGFFQIAMREEDKPKTAFISHRGSYQFVRMSMGLTNSPATFQRTVDTVVGDYK